MPNYDPVEVGFQECLHSHDPEVVARARNWQIAIGLQAVDGLKASSYLLELARENIEGKISSEEVERRICLYHGIGSASSAEDSESL